MKLDLASMNETFARDGVLVVENLFDPSELNDINAALDEHWQASHESGEDEQAKKDFEHIKCQVMLWWHAEMDDMRVRALMQSDKLRDTTANLLGPEYTHLHTLIAYSLPGGDGQAWHQDSRAQDNNKHFNVNRLIYTRDTTEEDGAVVAVPGSHRAVEIPHGGEQDDIPGQKIICPKAGTVVFLHGRCYHRVLPNVSGRMRISVNFRVKSPGASDRLIDRPIYRHMDAAERETFNAHLIETED